MIYGEGIRLTAIEREDLPLFVAWINDPEVREGLAMYLPMSMANEERWFEKMLERDLDTQPLTIGVLEGEDWIKIGNLGFFNLNHRAHKAEFGIMIGNKAYWNKGYGTQAINLLLKHGFETLNLNRIMLEVYEDNPRAIRCYEKVGFVHEGRLREARYHQGRYFDILQMSVLKHEWNQKKGNNQDAK